MISLLDYFQALRLNVSLIQEERMGGGRGVGGGGWGQQDVRTCLSKNPDIDSSLLDDNFSSGAQNSIWHKRGLECSQK